MVCPSGRLKVIVVAIRKLQVVNTERAGCHFRCAALNVYLRLRGRAHQVGRDLLAALLRGHRLAVLRRRGILPATA